MDSLDGRDHLLYFIFWFYFSQERKKERRMASVCVNDPDLSRQENEGT